MLDDSKNENMIQAANALIPNEQGEIVLPQSTQLTHTSSAVFAEPVIPAQPMLPTQRRRIPDFLQRMKILAQMAGEDYRYSFPVKTKGGTKTIEGGTIKLANDLVREYGNCMVDVRVIEQGDSHVFYARFVDYETGFCMTRPFRQRKGQKTMKTDEERAADIVFQIGASKAIRNVVLNSLGTYADFTYEEAKNSLVKNIGQKIEFYRGKISEKCKDRGYDLKKIEASVGKPVNEWLAPELAKVIAEFKSINDGMASFEELYSNSTASVDALNAEFVEVKKEPKRSKKAQDTTLTEEQQAVENLFAEIEKTPREERGSKFVELNGLEIIDKAGRSKTIDEAFASIGIILPPTDEENNGTGTDDQAGKKETPDAVSADAGQS